MLNSPHFAIILPILNSEDASGKSGMGGRDIIQDIAQSAKAYTDPDGENFPVISLKAVTSIARGQGIAIREVEIAALKQGITPRRYFRNIGTIGLKGQMKLLQSTVAVVGAGGLGGTIIELLARQGIGHLIIIDDDRFVEQNLNRQLMSTEKNLGKYKVIVAAKRVETINSATSVTTFVERLTRDNARRLLSDAMVVADGLDNLPSRFAVEQACRDLGIPFVHGTIAGFCGQLMTIFPGDAGLHCIYGSADSFHEQGIEVRIGNPSATPAIVAAWQVQEIVKILTGIGKPLRDHLLLLDMMEGTADRIDLK
jgi:molybdopterin/thiamine biosynthesis adenylyltransferase